jgi:nicotinamide phosphoribosyltransferase
MIKRYLCGVQVTREKIDEAKDLFAQHFPPGSTNTFNLEGWEYILEKHGGVLPVKINAVPEGTVVPTKNVLMTVENTDPHCYWLVNYLETFLVQVWYPMTVCTNSYFQKHLIKRYLEETGEEGCLAGLGFKLHDFGFRGSSSVESSGLGASAHLVNFMGTDTVSGLVIPRKFYGETGCAGFSIPASEHSTITSWGRENEVEAMRNMLEKYPTGPVACVSDSFDIYNACTNLWGGELKEKVMEREGFLVVRPDSGEPKEIVLKCCELLGEKFGTKVNSKGFKILDDHVRIIQGDGVSYETIGEILAVLKENGWSADNTAFGSGGALLQRLDRDTQKCAFKCCHIEIGEEHRDVYKEPITDPGKKSKKGQLFLHKEGDQLVTVARHEGNKRTVWRNGEPTEEGETTIAFETDEEDSLLVCVFENGELKNETTFQEIRDRSNA